MIPFALWWIWSPICTSGEKGPQFALWLILVNNGVSPFALQVKGSPPLPPSGEKSPFSILLLSLSLKSLSPSSFILIFFTFKDGGLLTNSPCALAIHEAKLVWPATPLQCVVSLGTGIYYNPSRQLNSTFSSLREKLLKVVASATDTEGSSYSPSPWLSFFLYSNQCTFFFCHSSAHNSRRPSAEERLLQI